MNNEILELKNEILELKLKNANLQNNLLVSERDVLSDKIIDFNSLFTREGVNTLFELNEKYKTLYNTLNNYIKLIIKIEEETSFIKDLLTGRLSIQNNK